MLVCVSARICKISFFKQVKTTKIPILSRQRSAMKIKVKSEAKKRGEKIEKQNNDLAKMNIQHVRCGQWHRKDLTRHSKRRDKL